MTDTTKEIFEKHQIRKTKKQKSTFIDFVEKISDQWGYSHHIEKGMLGARNIVVGDISTAKVIYTAHYDTCPVLPFPNFITPKCLSLYILYQIALVGAFFLAAGLLGVAVGVFTALIGAELIYVYAVAEVIYLLLFLMLFMGPANKHTANDNTSGVTLLIDIMRDLPSEQRENVAFVFFDLEEMGLFGSASFASAHKAEMKNRLLLNFDCVSDGENIIFALKKGAKPYHQAIESAFEEKDSFKVEVADKGIFYPSDQANFPCGVGVAALRSTKKGLLYMNRIHTKRDVIYKEENIEFLKNGAIELLNNI